MLARNVFLWALILFLPACSYILDEPKMSASSKNEKQREVQIKSVPLTKKIIEELNAASFNKSLLVAGPDKHKLSPTSTEFKFVPLPTTEPVEYRFGVGDLLLLTIVSENILPNSIKPLSTNRFPSTNLSFLERANPLTLSSRNIRARNQIENRTSRVGADGSILFIETGRLHVKGKTIPEVRELVSNALLQSGLDSRFQLEILEYNSQIISLISYNSPVNNLNSDSEIGSALFKITERPVTLREILVQAGLSLKKNVVELVTIQRESTDYQMTLNQIFSVDAPDYYLTGGDVVTVETFKFKRENAFVLGGLSKPIAIPIAEEEPVALANALFVDGGVLSSRASKKSEVYLLRGSDILIAYHLDATNPARLALATELQLRPNDIVFASTVPIVDFNTVLSLINPLRLLTGQDQPLFSPAF